MRTIIGLYVKTGNEWMETGSSFQTKNERRQHIFDSCLDKLRGNLQQFGAYRVLVEGGGYQKIWLETQPMGGEMYACVDMEAALNNSLLFLRYQREDGRMPGSIAFRDGVLVPEYNKFQGFCFPWHALNLYYLCGRDAEYLGALREGLQGMHQYLTKYRKNPATGVLQSFCVYDTGEDNAVRFADSPNYWTEDARPEGYRIVPMDSMDVTSWDFAACDTLREIAAILKDEREERKWNQCAQQIRDTLRTALWDDRLDACFDRDAHGHVMPQLIHNNLRCMYWGSFSQNMADRFVEKHLLNPKEFWTRLPLPSVAVSDLDFRNAPENNWSGQCEGLTFQRAVLALERYGKTEIMTEIGRKFLDVLADGGYVYPQQFDPLTGKPTIVGMISHAPLKPGDTEPAQDAYGPTMLAALEYLAHMEGIDIEFDHVLFSAVQGETFEAARKWGEHEYVLSSDGVTAKAYLDGRLLSAFPAGCRMVTGTDGVPVSELVPLG